MVQHGLGDQAVRTDASGNFSHHVRRVLERRRIYWSSQVARSSSVTTGVPL